MKGYRRHIHLLNIFREKKKGFFTNIAVGILIALALHLAMYTEWGENIINTTFDILVRYDADRARKENDDKDIMFVDINDATYREWGRSAVTRRDRLADIIEFLWKSGSKVIVLDVLLEHYDCCHPGADAKLKALLGRIGKGKGQTKVVLVSGITYDEHGMGHLRKTIYDGLVDGKNIYWSIPVFSASADDRIQRYFLSYELVKNETGREMVLWGSSLLASALYLDKTAELEKIGLSITHSIESIRKKKNLHEIGVIRIDRNSSIKIPFDTQHLYLQRVRFPFIPLQGGNPGIVKESHGRTLKHTIPARTLTRPGSTEEKKHLRGLFREKIVIIGSSSREFNDSHPTPLGVMPGMYIVGNALYTIKNGFQPVLVPWWLGIIVEIIAIGIAAYIFYHFNPLPAQIVCTVLIVVILAPLTWIFFFKFGTFLNILVPVAGMSVHKTVSTVEEFFEKRIEYFKKRKKNVANANEQEAKETNHETKK